MEIYLPYSRSICERGIAVLVCWGLNRNQTFFPFLRIFCWNMIWFNYAFPTVQSTLMPPMPIYCNCSPLVSFILKNTLKNKVSIRNFFRCLTRKNKLGKQIIASLMYSTNIHHCVVKKVLPEVSTHNFLLLSNSFHHCKSRNGIPLEAEIRT